MSDLIFLSCLLLLGSWNVSGDSAEHENLKSILQDFEARILEKVGSQIDQLRLDFIEKSPPKTVCNQMQLK